MTKIVDKIKELLKTNNVTPESVYSLTLEERIEMAPSNYLGGAHQEIKIFKKLLNKKNIPLFKEGELHNYIHANKEKLNLYHIYLIDYITDIDDIFIILNQIPAHSIQGNRIEIIVSAVKRFNDARLVDKFMRIFGIDDESRGINQADILEEIEKLFNSLHNDEYKKNLLENPPLKLEQETEKKIILSMDSDENKVKYIHKFSPKYYPLISSLKADKIKEKYLKRYWLLLSGKEKINIIRTFQSEEIKMFFYCKLNSNNQILYLTDNPNSMFIIRQTGATISSRVASIIIENINFEEYEPKGLATLLQSLPLESLVSHKSKFINKLQNSIAISKNPQEYQIIIDKIIAKMPQKIIYTFLKENIPLSIALDNLNLLIKPKDKIKAIIEGNHSGICQYQEKYNSFLEGFSKYYQIPLNHLVLFLSSYGMQALPLLKNENILKLIRLKQEELIKCLNLFDLKSNEITDQSIIDILNLLSTKAFMKEKNNITSVFSRIYYAIQTQNKSEIISILTTIDKSTNILETILSQKNKVEEMVNYLLEEIKENDALSSDNLEQIQVELNSLKSMFDLINSILVNNSLNIDEFINRLLQNEKQAISLLHVITNEYINKEKGEYCRKVQIDQKFKNSQKLYNINQSIKHIFENNSIEKIFEAIINIIEEEKSQNKLLPEELEILENQDILLQLITFKKDPKSLNEKPDKTSIKIFNSFIKKNINMLSRKLYFNEYVISYDYEINNRGSEESILEILSEIDFNLMSSGVLKDENKFNLLKQFLNKSRILCWGNKFEYLSSKANIISNPLIIAAMISHFNEIYDYIYSREYNKIKTSHPEYSKEEIQNEVSKSIDIASLLDVSLSYSPDLSKYKNIFGEEDFKIILEDKGPNNSEKSKIERLDSCVVLYKEMYQRTELTVPPIDKNYSIKSGKQINIVVGNVTNPMNLDYGERTGACMRLGGNADSLFRFACTNKNGFQIRFSNPDTGELISRVTGFRNGNTVFLNQLRFSLDDMYTNDDLIEACKTISAEIIELSKNSKYPIKNVVISPSCVFQKTHEKETDLQVSDIGKGLGDVYHDVTSQAIVLASSNADGSLVPVSLGKDKVEIYKPQRDKINFLSGEELIDNVQRINSMNQLLLGKKPEEIKPISKEKTDNFLAGYIGEDFYIIITRSNELIYNVIQTRRNNIDTMQEFKEVMIQAEEKRQNYFETNSKKIA